MVELVDTGASKAPAERRRSSSLLSEHLVEKINLFSLVQEYVLNSDSNSWGYKSDAINFSRSLLHDRERHGTLIDIL